MVSDPGWLHNPAVHRCRIELYPEYSVIISDPTRTGHSLQQTSSEPESEYLIMGETAVSQEQIGTDRINVNENFMIRHHAILMSRSMSALPAWPQMRLGMMKMSPRY